MNHFEYINGVLHAEGVSIPEMAEKVGTPFFCYSTATLERHYNVYADAFEGLMPPSALRSRQTRTRRSENPANLGAGADVVSVGEMRRALRAGIDPAKIIFFGCGQSRRRNARSP